MRDGNVLKFDSVQTCNACRHCGIITMPGKVIQKVCKRYPPTLALQAIPVNGQIQWAGNTAWPLLSGDDCCGEFSAKAAALS